MDWALAHSAQRLDIRSNSKPKPALHIGNAVIFFHEQFYHG